MAYMNTSLIARKGYAGRRRPMSGAMGALGSFLDDVAGFVKSGASSAIDFYGKTEQQAGANAALTAQNAQLTAALSQQRPAGGIDTTTLLIGGGAIVAAVLLFRRK